ncbi:unnamed protein product [Phaedon cochleariae]|uniref:Uncharacterized protein n=1 Tax=Phaedon cochleariae TaxID=80249 RepID=A0A9N9SFX3_PHACE|nr:unnamed protein product [Phaedon cochleariae]
MSAWGVVNFPKEDTVEAVPVVWMRGSNQCYWPPFGGLNLKSAISKCMLRSPEWDVHEARVIGEEYGDLSVARMKALEAKNTSDLNSDSDLLGQGHKKIRTNERYMIDSDSDKENDYTPSPETSQILMPVLKTREAKKSAPTSDDFEIDSNPDSWKQDPSYKDWLIKINNLTAKCVFCNVEFTIKHDGEKALKTHNNSQKHCASSNNRAKNQLLTAFMPKKNSTDDLYVTIIEVSQIYHGVNHHHSYLSTDCGIKLNTTLYKDSAFAKKVHCGRTKAEAIVMNCSGPKSIESSLEEMGANTNQTIPFSVSCDASNKGNQKLFPVAVRYFSVKNGIQDKLLDFIENNDESSASITNSIKITLEMCRLKMCDVSSYSADNASVNYGVHNSIYQKLVLSNPNILIANCNCHVIHNAGRNACKALSYDVENLVLKVYAEFSNSSKKSELLRECFEFMDMEYEKILRHVSTRWLSLFVAVDRLLKCWPAVKKYFLELGEDDCNKTVWRFVKNREHGLEEDINAQLTFPECYLYFVHHYMNVLNTHILKLESKSLTIIELHDIMNELKNNISHRLADNFFGAKVNTALKYLGKSEKQKFISEASLVYKKTIDTPYQHFVHLNIKKNKNITYQQILDAKNYAKVANIDEDRLYDEIVILKTALNEIDENELNVKKIDEIWVKIFQNAELPQLLKIVEFDETGCVETNPRNDDIEPANIMKPTTEPDEVYVSNTRVYQSGASKIVHAASKIESVEPNNMTKKISEHTEDQKVSADCENIDSWKTPIISSPQQEITRVDVYNQGISLNDPTPETSSENQKANISGDEILSVLNTEGNMFNQTHVFCVVPGVEISLEDSSDRESDTKKHDVQFPNNQEDLRNQAVTDIESLVDTENSDSESSGPEEEVAEITDERIIELVDYSESENSEDNSMQKNTLEAEECERKRRKRHKVSIDDWTSRKQRADIEKGRPYKGKEKEGGKWKYTGQKSSCAPNCIYNAATEQSIDRSIQINNKPVSKPSTISILCLAASSSCSVVAEQSTMPRLSTQVLSQTTTVEDRTLRSQKTDTSNDTTIEQIIQQVSLNVAANLEVKFDDFHESLGGFQRQVSENTHRIQQIDLRMDALEQYTRRCSLRIYGIEAQSQENVLEAVIDFFKTKMKIKHSTQQDIEHEYSISNNVVLVKLKSYGAKR